MAIGNEGFIDVKSRTKQYVAGFAILIELCQPLAPEFDATSMGCDNSLGYLISGVVLAVLGVTGTDPIPAVGTEVTIMLRPGDARRAIHGDLHRTRETRRFLIEGVLGQEGSLQARWAHGAGDNRHVQGLEIVGAPHISFENPIPSDGPRNRFLRLNLDGSPTVFDTRRGDGVYIEREFTYDLVVQRLQAALDQNLRFHISQRVLMPSASSPIESQEDLTAALVGFRELGFTSSVVRTFVPGTTDPKLVDVQLLSWPQDIPETPSFKGVIYSQPALQDTPRFASLRDGGVQASMEIIPGYVLSLVGNKDIDRSTKHKFARDVIKGLSIKQKRMYGTQNYGPGISIRAVDEHGEVMALTRLALRTDGRQYRNLMLIPTPQFPQADQIVLSAKVAPTPADNVSGS